MNSGIPDYSVRPLITLLVVVGKHRHDIPTLQTAYDEYVGVVKQHLDEMQQQIMFLEQLGDYIIGEMASCTPGANMYNVGQAQHTSIRKDRRKLSHELGALQELFQEALATTP